MMKEEKLSYYINKASELTNQSFDRKIRIAILGSFTLNGLAETIQVKCAEKKIQCVTHVGNYNQYNQEILNPQSNLYKFNPDISFLLIDTRTLLKDLFHHPHSISAEERRNLVVEKTKEISNLVNKFRQTTKSNLVIANFSIPTFSSYGIFESRTDFGFHRMLNEINNALSDVLSNSDSVYVYDFAKFVTKFGEKHIFDYKQFFFGDIKISLDYIPHLASELMSYVIGYLGISKKCIVLDLDNTLWGGVVGEDGFNGIKLGPEPPGNVFLEFQKTLLSFHQRGIILAINSKNNYDDAIKVIREHPYMQLKEDHFASLKINWNDKVTNMKDLAEEINIEFSVLNITHEDQQRGKIYAEQRKRTELEKSSTDLQGFLKQLNLKVSIKNASEFTIPRISQLTLKTNQFNLTTKRYQESDIKKFSQDTNYIVGCAQVEDKFGDNGITGAFIVHKESHKEWMLDTFLLSCRVMGREVEKGILGHIINKAKESRVERLKARFAPTAKNKPIEDFLPSCGFEKEGDQWVYNIKSQFVIPDCLTVSAE
ncbi:MAG: HAD-IIIC family phosphatase [Thaumarchaeota archaeon]|nr:HAD-IIIC family phosphatase [Nitrososphaerota archaeon]